MKRLISIFLALTMVFALSTNAFAYDLPQDRASKDEIEVYVTRISTESLSTKYCASEDTTNRDGYREYRSDPRVCVNCPTRHLCTHSKDCVKTVQRHIWKDYEDLADDVRYTPKYQRLYKRRKETIERVFADAKEKYAMRYTQYRGLAQVSNWVKLKFAAMNLKKLACWLWKEKLAPFTLILLWQLYTRNPAYA